MIWRSTIPFTSDHVDGSFHCLRSSPRRNLHNGGSGPERVPHCAVQTSGGISTDGEPSRIPVNVKEWAAAARTASRLAKSWTTIIRWEVVPDVAATRRPPSVEDDTVTRS